VSGTAPRIRLAHLFPEQLNLYGDTGNIAVLTARAAWRGIAVDVTSVTRARELAPDTNVIFIGGGPDRAQATVASELALLAPRLTERIEDGATLLAVCGGYQGLGRVYKSAHAGSIPGLGIIAASTEASEGSSRLAGGCVVRLTPGSPIAVAGRDSAEAAGAAGEHETLVGFENHSGRTWLEDPSASLGRVVHGAGNNGRDRTEGFVSWPGPNGRPGLVIGTYLHGPLLPRNPHVADYLLASALATQGVRELRPIDDRQEWAAHRLFARRWLATS
jgi:lipid II isoglutaminyl synthase (glutamine-hydrolysing)